MTIVCKYRIHILEVCFPQFSFLVVVNPHWICSMFTFPVDFSSPLHSPLFPCSCSDDFPSPLPLLLPSPQRVMNNGVCTRVDKKAGRVLIDGGLRLVEASSSRVSRIPGFRCCACTSRNSARAPSAACPTAHPYPCSCVSTIATFSNPHPRRNPTGDSNPLPQHLPYQSMCVIFPVLRVPGHWPSFLF